MIFTRILTHYCDMLKCYYVREKIDRIITPACLFDDGIVLQKLRSSIDYLLAPFCMTRTFYCDWKAEFCDALTSCTFSLEKLLRAEQRKKRRRACGAARCARDRRLAEWVEKQDKSWCIRAAGMLGSDRLDLKLSLPRIWGTDHYTYSLCINRGLNSLIKRQLVPCLLVFTKEWELFIFKFHQATD